VALTCPCLDCGALTKDGSRCSRCYARRRGTTTERGYGAAHQRRARAAIAAQPACSVCGHPGSPDNPLTGDHVVPVSCGGERGPLRVACRRCNSRRGNAGLP
jgi:5-methylcytosine-specific restriction endonuclease McrA